MAITRKSLADRVSEASEERRAKDAQQELQRALLQRYRDIERLRHENDLLKRRVGALETVSAPLAEGGGPAQMSRSMAEVITEAAGAEAGSIILIDPDTNELFFDSATGEKGEQVKQFRLKMGEGIAGWVAQSREPRIVNAPEAEPRHRRDIAEAIDYATDNIMAAPMCVGSELVGVLEVLNRADGQPFTEADLRLFEPLAALVAIAIQNSRAHAAAEKRIHELGLLVGVGQAISGMADLEELLGTAMFMVAKLLNAEAASCMRLDDDGEQLSFVTAVGPKSEAVRRETCKVGEGVAGWVARHGEPLLVRNTGLDPRFTGHLSERTEFQTRSILAAPIKVGDALLGVVEVLNPLGDSHFDEHDLEMLSTLASQVGVAMHNTQLMAEARDLFFSTVDALADAVDRRHPFTHGHARTVASISAAVADQMNLSDDYRESLHLTALFHGFGKISIAGDILERPGPLTEDEWELVRQHPLTGSQIIENIDHPVMKRVTVALRHLREWWNGSGYPEGLTGEKIPVESRIVAVADTFCVLVRGRPYRPARPEGRALHEIHRCAGTQFDPAVAEALLLSRQEDPTPI